MNRRGQSAIEFIMSYGWAVIVMVVIIGALGFTGILTPTKDIVTTCILPPGIACEDVSLYSDRIYFFLRNGAFDVRITQIQVGSCGLAVNETLTSGDAKQFILSSCSVGNPGNQLLEKIQIQYTSLSSNLPKETTGEVKGIIQ